MSNHHGDTQVQVFVSHKTEDKRLAEKIRDKLMILSIGNIRPNLCYEIPGGEQYQDVIEESLRNSKILIFLYTSKEADLKWCLYEAGVFVGSDKSQKKHLLCIKASAIEEPPVAMKNLQAYNANREGIENFFIAEVAEKKAYEYKQQPDNAHLQRHLTKRRYPGKNIYEFL